MSYENGLDLVSPRAYGEHGVPHDPWRELRKSEQLRLLHPRGFAPFYPVVRHDHICEISKHPETFINSKGIVLETDQQKLILENGLRMFRSIINMDPPEHRDYRKVAVPWFTPRAIRQRVETVVKESARDLIDELVARSQDGTGTCEFATEVAAAHPLRVLSTILGVPREQEPKILELTNQLFATDDPDLQRKGENRLEALNELATEMLLMFNEIIENRRANPRDDLASVLANGKVHGDAMGPAETMGYYIITFSAGHDTTKNALAGGICALAENPREFEKIKRDPTLIPSAVEEIIRWAAPVNYMKRVVAKDVDFHGQTLREGENLVLFYASGNRDESVFEDPYSFRVDRDPNPHLGFGIGEHFCLGAHLARASQVALLEELVSRIDAIELAGEPEQIQSSFVVGLKKLPIQYTVKGAGA